MSNEPTTTQLSPLRRALVALHAKRGRSHARILEVGRIKQLTPRSYRGEVCVARHLGKLHFFRFTATHSRRYVSVTALGVTHKELV